MHHCYLDGKQSRNTIRCSNLRHSVCYDNNSDESMANQSRGKKRYWKGVIIFSLQWNLWVTLSTRMYSTLSISRQVFACVAATTALVDFLAPLYSLLYEYTLEWYSGFCYCLTATLNIIMIILALYCRWYSIRWSQDFKIVNSGWYIFC